MRFPQSVTCARVLVVGRPPWPPPPVHSTNINCDGCPAAFLVIVFIGSTALAVIKLQVQSPTYTAVFMLRVGVE